MICLTIKFSKNGFQNFYVKTYLFSLIILILYNIFLSMIYSNVRITDLTKNKTSQK